MELHPAKHVPPNHNPPAPDRTQSQQTLDTLATADTHLPDDRSQHSSQPSPSRADETVSASGSPGAARRRPTNRSAARNSTAYVRNYRLSRYRNALRGALPFRLQPISDDAELPLDSIGCVSASTFSWARRYRVPDPPILRSSATRWRWPWPFCRRRGAAETAGVAAADIEAAVPPPAAAAPAQPPPAPPLVPSLPAADRCEVNAKRLLGLYKYEEQSRGRIGASMARVAWQFCRTRLAVATVALCAAQLAAVLQLGLFLQLGMLLIDESWVFGVPIGFQGNAVLLRRYMGYSLQTGVVFGGLLVCLLAQSYLRGTAHAIGLRTAIRLRTACLGAVCSKSLKSAVRHTVAAHQIATLAADEGRHLSEAVVQAPALVANLLGLVFCAVAAGCSLGAPGVWPLLGVIGLLPVGVVGALLSATYFQRSLSFLAKKLTIVEEYFVAYDPDEGLRRHESYAKRFAGALHTQYLNLCQAERFRAPGQAAVFALSVIVGGAYLMWCDMKFPLEATPMTAIACMYVLLVPGMVSEWLEAVQAMAHARGVLAKVKQALTLAPPELPKMRPTRDLKVLISDAVFRWSDVAADAGGSGNGLVTTGVAYANGSATANAMAAAPPPQFELRIDSLTVAKNSLVGITGSAGSGKTALVHALLGHLPLRVGEFYQRDKGSLYPEVPYRLEGASIRENIVFHDDWNEQRYREALQLAELHFNEGADLETAIDDVQDLLQLQRIGVARALYSDRDFVVLEEPLSAVDLEADLSAMFEVCTDRLREQGKTVVVVSQNESILRHCQRIYVLTGGRSAGYLDHEDAQQQPEYRRCVEEYAERKRAARQSVHLGAIGGLTSVHNISTEDLVEAAAAEQTAAEAKTPWLLSRCQMATLAALRVLDAIYTFNVPIVTVIYLTHSTPPSPWAVVNVLIFVPILLLTGWLTTTWLSRVGRGVHKTLEKRQFRKLLGTALADQRDALLGQLQHTMIENSLRKFRNNADAAFGWWIVVMCVLWCFVNKSVMFLAVLVPLLSSCHRVLRYYLTVHRYGMLESETRLKLLHLLGNQLRGRVVIQSFDAVQRLRQSLYRAVEENAAAELVMRGTIAYNQHSFVFWQTVTLAFCLFLLNAYPHQQSLEFGIEVYFYLMAVGQLSRMIGYRLENCNYEQRLSSAHWMLSASGDNSAAADISTLRYSI